MVFSFAYGSRGRVHNGMQTWQQATSARSWEITSSTTSLKKKVIWKWGKAVNSQNLLPGMNFIQQACPCIASLNSATNWEPGVHMLEPVGDIFQSNHYTVSQRQANKQKQKIQEDSMAYIYDLSSLKLPKFTQKQGFQSLVLFGLGAKSPCVGQTGLKLLLLPS